MTDISQKIDSLARKRDRYVKELKEVAEIRRKEPELRNVTAKISTLEMRLKHSRRDKQLSVSVWGSVGVSVWVSECVSEWVWEWVCEWVSE